MRPFLRLRDLDASLKLSTQRVITGSPDSFLENFRRENGSKSLSRLAQVLFCLTSFCLPWMAQDNYEVQVYGADTVEPRTTTVEFHTSFTLDGSKLIAMAL